MAKGVLIGSHNISVRLCPWDPLADEVIKEFEKGETVFVDSSKTIYDWQGHEFYPFVEDGHQNGYIRKDAIRLNTGGGQNAGRRRTNR